MSDYFVNKVYFVYRHVVPNGKMYIGITSKPRPELRWGKDGKAYSKNNRHFWNAIQKYGWDNIQHIIVAHGLDVERACHLEQYLITKYDTFNNGYNQTSGGVYPTEVTDEVRAVIGAKIRKYHESLPEGFWSDKFKGHMISKEARLRQAASLRGRKIPKDVIDRRVATFKANLTPEIRYKMGNGGRGRKMSDATKEKIRAANTGKLITEHQKEIQRIKAIKRFSIKHVWVHRDLHELEIPVHELDAYLAQGYVVGRSNIKNVYVTKDDVTIKICDKDLDQYISEGWVRGFSKSRYQNINKTRIKFVYSYKGTHFYSGKSLAEYLRSNGYPKIVQGTINNICNGRVICAYPELSVDIQRRSVHEDI